MPTRRKPTRPKRQRRTRSKALASARSPVLRQELLPAAAGADLFELMSTMAARCAELPLRLLRARSPLEVWQEQMRFVQSVTNAYQLAARMTAMQTLQAGRANAKRARSSGGKR